MALVSHLSNGELAEWCEQHLVGAVDVAHEVGERVRGADVTRPAEKVDRRHWSQVARTFSARLSALVQAAPPYTTLLGLIRSGLASWDWAHAQAARYPTHARLPAADRARALDFRPTPTGWLDLRVAHERGAAVLEVDQPNTLPPVHEPMLTELFDRIRAYLWEHAPLGHVGGPGREAGLARVSWLLGAFAYAYRADTTHPVFHLFKEGSPTLGQLHALADDTAITDPLALIHRLVTTGVLDDLRALTGSRAVGEPWGVTAPVVFDHWDDGTLLLTGPRGSTLLDVNCAVRVDSGQRAHRWVWNLLGAVWLDTADTHRIRTVAVYFARHGILLTWPVDVLAELTLRGADPAEAQARFVTLAGQRRDEDYARRLRWRASPTTQAHQPAADR
ncbi:hypothetical protein [Amycolatopsis azurea]|uniref:Uncharacterized protein n=1 Tax=Amycolatopsis azurea DSM 43854 TaxID=1238180 RepID=M2Q9Q1_9PSEU|nr:hypothetical protein [Amycolatopsis azurea]EMD23406.1 hypothetical protein C791_7232 [Amycolatopsis azurea DSM 43854]OOC04910.1 hypothetical protein B0293_20900 [Amycolatopsis azurea DSM 43854]